MSGLNDIEIAGRIRQVLVDSLSLEVNAEEISYADRLDEVIGLDSMAVLEFVAALEKEFGIVLDPDQLELEKLKDLPKLASYIREQAAR